MKRKFHVRFLEELERVIAPSYSAGNSCGGKGLTEVRVTLGSHLPHLEVGNR